MAVSSRSAGALDAAVEAGDLEATASKLGRRRRVAAVVAAALMVGALLLSVALTPPQIARDEQLASTPAGSVYPLPLESDRRTLAIDDAATVTSLSSQPEVPVDPGLPPALSAALPLPASVTTLPPLTLPSDDAADAREVFSRPATPPDLRTNKDSWSRTGKLFGLIAHAWPTDAAGWNEARAALGGARPSSQMWFVRLDGTIDVASVIASHDSGALPIISIEPRPLAAQSAEQAFAPLAKVAGGLYDVQLRAFAAALRDSGVVVGVRFAHEMNGNWFPWGMDVNGNTPSDFVAAWRHVHEVFRSEGAANVLWIWSPNVTVGRLAEAYPGDDYVDWMGLSGYFLNFDSNDFAPLAPTYEQLFGPDLDALELISSKPVLITETGADGAGSQKERFIADLLAGVARDDRVIGFVWYNKPYPDWGADLRFNSTPEAVAVFRAGLGNGAFAFDLMYG